MIFINDAHLWCLPPYLQVACVKICFREIIAFSIRPFKKLLKILILSYQSTLQWSEGTFG